MTLLVSSSTYHFCFPLPETKGCVSRVTVVTGVWGSPVLSLETRFDHIPSVTSCFVLEYLG